MPTLPQKYTVDTQQDSLWLLVHSLLHWYDNISSFFLSRGLQGSPFSLCVFTDTLLPDYPPIYIGLYVDDFCYFSPSNEVEL